VLPGVLARRRVLPAPLRDRPHRGQHPETKYERHPIMDTSPASATAEQMPPAFVTAYEEPGRERFRLRLADVENGTV
jgi:hypothetical protein